MDLQLFYRDTEQAETWMNKQEAFLANQDLGDSLDAVESLIKKHQDFEKSLAAQEEKINALDEFATKLIQVHITRNARKRMVLTAFVCRVSTTLLMTCLEDAMHFLIAGVVSWIVLLIVLASFMRITRNRHSIGLRARYGFVLCKRKTWFSVTATRWKAGSKRS